MMLLGPSQQTRGWCRVPLRWVLLPDGDGYSAVWRQTSGKTTGNLGSAWGFLLYQKDTCLVLSFYRFSHIWLAGGRYWRNRGGCQHTAVKTKLCETTGNSTIPAGLEIHTASSTTLALPGPRALWQSVGHRRSACGYPGLITMQTASRTGQAGGQQRETAGGKWCRKLPEETGKQSRGRMWVYMGWHQRRL